MSLAATCSVIRRRMRRLLRPPMRRCARRMQRRRCRRCRLTSLFARGETHAGSGNQSPVERCRVRRRLCLEPCWLCVLRGRRRDPAAHFPADGGGAPNDGLQHRRAGRQFVGAAPDHSVGRQPAPDRRRRAWHLAAIYLLQNADTHILRVAFGIIVAVYAGYRRWRGVPQQPAGGSRR